MAGSVSVSVSVAVSLSVSVCVSVSVDRAARTPFWGPGFLNQPESSGRLPQ